jgi:endonuclease YncB( thermonuclease family)
LSDGTDLAAEMVRSGHALDWRRHSGGRYRPLEPEGIRNRLWRADARQKGRFPPRSNGA